MSSPLSKLARTPVLAALFIALAFVIALVVIAARLDPGLGSTNAVFAYESPGVVFNRITGNRLAGARLDCTVTKVTSDVLGRFTLSLGPNATSRCRVTAAGFETQFIDARSATHVGVWLTPNPILTIRQLIEWEKDRDFGRQYDLLHPDVRRSWSREEYVRLMTLSQSRRVLSIEQEPEVQLPSWDNFGDVYHGVALVPTWITYDDGGRQTRTLWEAHLVRVDGVWRWFREPGA